MKEKFENSYTVFAGGDDLLIVGSYDQMIELAVFVRQEFSFKLPLHCLKLRAISTSYIITPLVLKFHYTI